MKWAGSLYICCIFIHCWRKSTYLAKDGTCQSAMLYSYFLQCLKATNVFTRHVLGETSQTDMHIHLLPSLLPNKWLCPGLSFPWLSLLIKVMLMDNPNGKVHLFLIGLAVNRKKCQKCLITNCRLCSSFGAGILQHLDKISLMTYSQLRKAQLKLFDLTSFVVIL